MKDIQGVEIRKPAKIMQICMYECMLKERKLKSFIESLKKLRYFCVAIQNLRKTFFQLLIPGN